MSYDPQAGQQRRETFLALFLALLLGGGILGFLAIITGGLFLYLIPVVAGVTAFGYVHYLLWGRALSKQVAGEREASGDEWERDEADGAEHC